MKLQDLERIAELRDELESANRVLSAFVQVQGDTVRVQARSIVVDGSYGRGGETVDLLPVPKEVAVSAAQRAVSKVVDQLLQLGVQVD